MKLVQILLFVILISSFGSVAAASLLRRLGQKTMYPFRVTKQKIVHGTQCISNKYKKICAVTLPTLLCWQIFGSGTAPAYFAHKEREELEKEIDAENGKLKSSPYNHSQNTLEQRKQEILTEQTKKKLKPVQEKLNNIKEELKHLEHHSQPLTIRIGAHLGQLLYKNDVFNNLFKGTKTQETITIKKEPQATPKTNKFPQKTPANNTSPNSQESATTKLFRFCGIEQVEQVEQVEQEELVIKAPEPRKKILGIF